MVAAVVRRVSPELQAAVIGGVAGGLVGGVLGILGVIIGMIEKRVGPRIGKVDCDIKDGDWYVQTGAGSEVQARTLRVAFTNHKDVHVVVRDMRLEFSRGGEPLAEWAHPKLQMEAGRKLDDVSPVDLPPHKPVLLTLQVHPGRDDIIRELGTMDCTEFVAVLIGAKDKRKELNLAWGR